MTPREIAEAAIAQMSKKITDKIFLIIQNDRRLMHEYLRAVEKTRIGYCQPANRQSHQS